MNQCERREASENSEWRELNPSLGHNVYSRDLFAVERERASNEERAEKTSKERDGSRRWIWAESANVGSERVMNQGYPHASISSRSAFEWSLEKMVCDNISGFKLLFLHVQLPCIYASPQDLKGIKTGTGGHLLLEYFVRKCYEIGIIKKLTKLGNIRNGDPKDVICHEVKRIQPDMLIVGCRVFGPFQRVFVGTVSEFCQKHTECPVITIKRKAEEVPQDPVDN